MQSVLTVAGGPLFGFAVGWTLVGLLGKISSDAISEVCLTLTAAYLTFYVSEAVLGISGVLAVVALGVVMNSQRTVISPDVDPWMREYVSVSLDPHWNFYDSDFLGVRSCRFWDIITYIANTLIFVIVVRRASSFPIANLQYILRQRFTAYPGTHNSRARLVQFRKYGLDKPAYFVARVNCN